MQVKRKIYEGSVAAVASSSAFFSVPVHDVTDEIFIRPVDGTGADATKANCLTSIGNIAFTIDGNDVVNCSYGQLLDLYTTMGTNVLQNASSQVVGLNVGRLFLDNQDVRDAFGFGAANVANMQIRIECLTLTGVAAFEVYTIRRSISRNLETYFRAINYQQTIGGTGVLSVTTLPKNTHDIYYLLSLELGTGGVVAWNKLRANGSTVTDQIPESINAAFMNEFQYIHPNTQSCICLCDGSILSGLPVNNITELSADFNFTTAPSENSLPLLAVTLHNPSQQIVNALLA